MLVAFLILLSICAFVSTQAVKAATINPAVSAASFTPSSPITLGGSVTVSASVSAPSGASTAPTGNVQFMVKIGAAAYTNFGSTVALSGGSASISYTPQTATTYHFEAAYQGDTNYNSFTGAASGTLTVNKGTATVNTPTLNPSFSITYGSSITCSVTVSGVSGGPNPTGNVRFQYSTNSGTSWTNLGSTVALSGGSATSTSYTPSASGSNYRFRVSSYAGDSNYNSVSTASSAVALTVTKATPTTATTLSYTSRTLGQSVTDTATVSAVGSGTAPTGSVTFQVSTDGGVTFNQYGAVKSLSSRSATSDAYTASNVGSFYFRAVYSGDTNYLGSQSGNTAEPLTITNTAASVSAASFTPSSPITLGGSVTVSASVSAPSGVSTTPTGNVQFQVSINGGAYSNFGSLVALSGGSASVPYTAQTVTTYGFRAVYQGDNNYVSGTTGAASGTLTVNKGTANVPAPSLNPSGSTTVATSVSLSVTISGGGAAPTGSATFQVNIGGGGWSTIGSAVFLTSGSASITYVPQKVDSYQFQIIYSGDNNYNGPTNSSVVSLTVNSGSAAHLVVSSGTSQVAGTPFTLTVSVNDSYGNIVTGYTGTVNFTSSDSGPGVSLPSDYTFLSGDHGTHTFTNGVKLKTAGSQSITATDTVTSSITGSQPGIKMNPAALDHLAIIVPETVTAGSTFGSVNVTAYDAYNNVKTDYTGSVYFTSADSAATLPYSSLSKYLFAISDSGVHTFSGFNLKTIPSQTITVTDGSVSKQSASITVNAGSGIHFVVSGFPSSTTAGVVHTVTITPRDVYNNLVTSYTGTVAITSSDSQAVLPMNAGLTSGVGSFTVTLKTAGSQSITATETVTSSIAGSQTGITVNPAGLDHFVFITVGNQIAGSAFNITVTAKDVYGNNVIGYVGMPFLTISAGSISPSTMDAFVSGLGSTLVTVTGVGSDVTITTTDGIPSGISNSFTVSIASTPTPTPTLTQTTTSTPKPTNALATPTPKPSPSPTPLGTTVKAYTDSGATIDLAINGNVTSSQISNVTITTNHSPNSTMVSFTVTGESGTTGFSNMTIPKTVISYAKIPLVFIDDQQASYQGYTQDSNNFYVWYITQFSTHKVIIQFIFPSTSSAIPFGPVFAIVITVPEIILLFTVIAVRRLRRKPDNT